MTFNEAVQAMLKGAKVTRVNSTGHGYIMINDKGDVVGNGGDLYRLNKKDFIADWEIASIPAAGTLLMRYGKTYRLIKETGDTYAILNEETHVEYVKGLDEEHLISELECRDFSIARESSKDALDEAWNVARKHHNRLANTEWKLVNGKFPVC